MSRCVVHIDPRDETVLHTYIWNVHIGGDDTDYGDLVGNVLDHNFSSPSLPLKTEAPQTSKPAKINVTETRIYSDDRVSDFKLKLYAASGIPVYRQHLFYKIEDRCVPLSYTLQLDVVVPVDIIDQYKNSAQIHNIPIDKNLWHDREELRVIARDTTTTMSNIDATKFYLVDLGDVISRESLRTLLRSDRIQIDMIYSGFVVKFFPMLSPHAFEQLLDDESELGSSYPDLAPSIASVKSQLQLERERVDFAKQLMRAQPAPFKKYLDGKHIVVSVRAATLTIDAPAGARVSFDVMKFLNTIETSSQVPIVRALVQVGKKITQITKIYQDDPNIQRVYDSVRYRLRLQHPNTCIAVLRADDQYLVFVIQSNGKYMVRLSWEDETTTSLQQMIKLVDNNVNKFIEQINNLGRAVFSSPRKLSLATSTNSNYSNLHMNMYWYKSLGETEWNNLLGIFEKDLQAGIIKHPTDQEVLPNDYKFNMYKGMTDFDPTRIDEFGLNYYSYLTDSKSRSRWIATVDAGRLLTVHRRTTDVKIDLSDCSEQEFKRIHEYLITRFYECISGVKSVDKSAKKHPAVILEKNRLKLLKERDPQLYKFKRFGSDVVYSRICQKQNQPEIYYESEYDQLPRAKQVAAVKYWNFTANTPMYYYCPNPQFPYLNFRVGQHPKNWCLPCCKKTPVYEADISAGDAAKKTAIYNACIEKHEYREDTASTGSRYIMTYGKPLEIGRISYLPGLLDKYLMYNMPTAPAAPDDSIQVDGKNYTIKSIRKAARQVQITTMSRTLLDKYLDVPSELLGGFTAQALLRDPTLRPDYYERILSCDPTATVVLYEDMLVDGILQIALARHENTSELRVKNVKPKHLSLVKPSPPTDSSRDVHKQSNFYVFGVPQHTKSAENIGCMYVLAVSLRMDLKKLISAISDYLRSDSGANYFNLLLGGVLPRYFESVSALIAALQHLISSSIVKSNFHLWNEFFIDVAKYCFRKYCILWDDRTIDTTGTSIKNAHDDINLVLPEHVLSGEDIVPTSPDERREYILVLRRRRKSRNILSHEYHYYPIFVFVPHEFFKTLDIKQRLFSTNDSIIQLVRSLVDSMLGSASSICRETTLQTIVAYAGARIKRRYINKSDACYALYVDNIIMPISFSKIQPDPSLDTYELLTRSSQSVDAVANFCKKYNAWVLRVSKERGLIRAAESTVVPFTPLLQFDKLLLLHKNIIGAIDNTGLYWYFKSTPATPTGIKSVTAALKSLLHVRTDLSDLLWVLRYDPDDINAAIVRNARVSSMLDKRAESAMQRRGAYMTFVADIMNETDAERDNKLRGKIKKIIADSKLRTAADLTSVRTSVLSLLLYKVDRDTFESILTNNRDMLIDSFEDTIFQFDKHSLNALRDASDGYLSNEPAAQEKILKSLESIIRQIAKPLRRKDVSEMSQLFARELVNPLRRDYLLSGIFGISADLAHLKRNPSEKIFIST